MMRIYTIYLFLILGLLKMRNSLDFLTIAIENLEKKGIDIKNDICGFMLETFQGWGAIFYPGDYVKGSKNLQK